MKREPRMQEVVEAIRLDGRTAVLGILGDPVAQVKAPAPLTRLLQARGLNALLVPLHVQPADLAPMLAALGLLRNLAGFIVTVPHKQRVAEGLPGLLRPAARRAGAVNVARRAPGGAWEADLLDGLGFVAGLHAAGFDPCGRMACIVGAGGAASAIAFALAEAGAPRIGIHDIDAARRERLLAQLAAHGIDAVRWDGAGTQGAELLVQATPLGMRADDPLPVPLQALRPGLWVAEVVMAPAVTPLLEAAAARGCHVHAGRHMMERQLDLMADFFAPAIEAITTDTGAPT